MNSPCYRWHFTTGKGWMNDPNGLVYHNGVYHLYFQYNPNRLDWGEIGWGHATSKDLCTWTNHGLVMSPDEHGMIFSGSAVSVGNDIFFYYTAAPSGGEFSQRLAKSSDGGMTLVKDPVFEIPAICRENRDPKVFFHRESSAYVMVLWLCENEFAILRSENPSGRFEISQRFVLPGGFECPNLFEIDGVWFMWTADGFYYPGTFNGYTFSWNGVKHSAYADKIPYAAQIFSGTAETVMIPWLRIADAEKPMKWNGVMGIPRKLSAVKKGDDALIVQTPVFTNDTDITDGNIREYTTENGTLLHVELLP